MGSRTRRADVLQEQHPNHRVVALDNRNHGLSDKPEPKRRRAGRRHHRADGSSEDSANPHPRIFHGRRVHGPVAVEASGTLHYGRFRRLRISETDPELRKEAPAMDKPMPPPVGAESLQESHVSDCRRRGRCLPNTSTAWWRSSTRTTARSSLILRRARPGPVRLPRQQWRLSR